MRDYIEFWIAKELVGLGITLTIIFIFVVVAVIFHLLNVRDDKKRCKSTRFGHRCVLEKGHEDPHLMGGYVWSDRPY